MRVPVPILAAALLVARGAWAQPAPAPAEPRVYYPYPRVHVFADLTFTRGPGASICPDAWWVRALMAGRTGSESFAPDPRGVYVGRVSLVLSRTRDGFASDYTWENERGVTFRSPRYRHTGGYTFLDCREALENALVDLSVRFLALELALGERYAHKTPPPYCPEAPPSSPTSTPAPCPPATRWDIWPERPPAPLRKPEPDPPTPPERSPFAIRIGAATWVELIAADRLSVGLSLDAGVRRDWFSIGVELHGGPPLGSTLVSGTTEVSFASVSGALLPCAHWGLFAGCLEGLAGGILFPGQNLPARRYGAFGVRPIFEFPVVPARLFVVVAADLLATIDPPVVIDPQLMKRTFTAAGWRGGVGLGARFELAPSKAR